MLTIYDNLEYYLADKQFETRLEFAHNTSVLAMSDHETLAAGFDDGKVAIFNMRTGKLVKRPKVHHNGRVNGLAFGRGNLLASGSKDKNVFVWDSSTGQLVRQLPVEQTGAVTAVAFNKTNLLAAGSSGGTVRVWRTDSWQLVKEVC